MRSNKIYDIDRAPVDRVAARVISAGAKYEPNCKAQVEEFISPPAMKPKHLYPTDPSFIDLTGRKKGRFTVIGLLDGPKASTWVVRCSCGTYTTRTAKSIKSAETNKAAQLDACRECMHLAWLKREEIYRRTGKDVNLEDVWS